MIRIFAAASALALTLSGGALAETFEVQMLNKSEAGTMVFEPSFLRIAPGDTVKFLATERGHNAESMPDLMPEGAEPFKGKIDEEIEVTFDVDGLYGVKCLPHFAMGMVMTVAVGDLTEVPDDYLAKRIPPKPKKRIQEQLEQL